MVAKKLLKKKESVGGDALIADALRVMCVPMSSVRPWKDNPRKNDDAAKRVAELIKVNGFRVPVVVDQNGIIRAGNTRYKAAKILGMASIPVVRHTFKSEAEAVAFAISDNKASEYAEWDDKVLGRLMQIETLEACGFSAREFNKKFSDPDIVEINVVSEGVKLKAVAEAGEGVEFAIALKNWINGTEWKGKVCVKYC